MGAVGFIASVVAAGFAMAAAPLPSQYIWTSWDASTGLPEETIYSVAQTPDGYLWLSNANGLVRYDGQTFRTFQPRQNLGGGVKQEITQIGAGPGNSIWVYSAVFGLMRFQDGVFRRAPAYPTPCKVTQILADGDGSLIVCQERVLRISGGRVEQLTAGVRPLADRIQAAGRDQSGNLWIGFFRGGLAQIGHQGEVVRSYGPREGLPAGQVNYILKTGDNRMWAATEHGLALIDAKQIKVFTSHDGLPSDHIRRLAYDADGALWVGTLKGVALGRDGRFEHFPAIPSASIESILQDREANVWMTSSLMSLYRLRKPKFLTWGRPEGLRYERPRAALQVGKTVWVAQDNEIGVLFGGKIRNISFGSASIRFLESDSAGQVWALTEDGAFIIDPSTGEVKPIVLTGGATQMRSISRDREGRMWILTRDRIFMGRNGVVTPVPIANLPALDSRSDLRQSRDGRLWLTINRLGLFELRNGEAIPVVLGSDPELRRIFTFYIDADDDFWFGFDGGGLARWRIRDGKGTLARFGQEIGTPHNFVYQFAEDTRAYFWLGLRAGLVRVAKKELNSYLDGQKQEQPHEHFYDVGDGLRSSNFGIAHRTVTTLEPASDLWFLSLAGLVQIDTRYVPFNRLVPPVHIEEVSADDEALPFGRTVTIPPGTDHLTFKFAVPTLVARSRMQLRYRLEPFDSTWQNIALAPVTYSQLSPGKYTFSVAASNNDGVWNRQGATIEVIVQPMYYQTWWFRLLSVTLVLSGIVGVYRWRTNLLRREKARLEERVEQRTAELSEAMHVARNAAQAKADFLATMSHEIRTPMHGVLGTLELLSETGLNPQQADYLSTARNSSNSLLVLLNEILDLSKMEAGRMELHPAPFSLHQTIIEVTQLLQAQANIQGIGLSYAYDPTLPNAFEGDEMRIRQIIFNLVGNAVKFTTEGRVAVQASGSEREDGTWSLTIAVRDSGIGIPPEHLPSLFHDFVQVDSAANRQFGGSGLGLAICQRLAALMGGSIGVESELGRGSTFSFLVDLPAADTPAVPAHPPDPVPAERQIQANILLAEDNPVNQKVATQMLTSLGCRVTLAQNGHQAVDLARQQSFSLILMDCQMPEMDGFEASRLIRVALGGTPVIIALTGNALPGDRERCLQAGMNDYLAKPFGRADLILMLDRYLPSDGAQDQSCEVVVLGSAANEAVHIGDDGLEARVGRKVLQSER